MSDVFGHNDLSEAGGYAASPKRTGPTVDFGQDDPSTGVVPQGLSSKQITANPKTLGMSEGALAGFASDPQEMINIAARSIFPNEPLAQAAKRFGRTREGNIFYRDDSGELVPVELSTLGNIAQGLGKSIPVGAGAAAGIVTAPMAATGVGLAGTMAATGAAAASGEAIRQKLGDYLLGERSTNAIDPASVVMEGATSALGQGVGVGVGKVLERSAVQDLARYDVPATKDAMERARARGITLTPGQATGLKSLQAEEKRLATRIPETADQMDDFLQKQGRDVIAAFRQELQAISPKVDAESVGKSARGAAMAVLDKMKEKALTAARPLYEKAFQEGDKEIWSPELERLSGSPAVQRAMRTAVRKWKDFAIDDGFGAMNPGAAVEDGMIKFQGGGSIPAFPNLQFWDYVKRAMDAQVRAAKSPMGQAGDLKVLTGLTSKLRGELDRLAPGAYAEARRVYGTGADDVHNALQSALGIIADTSDTQVLSAARYAFDPKTRSPQMVARLRSAIEGQDPQAWQALKRLWIDDAVSSALKPAQSGQIINPAGKILGALEAPGMEGNLRAALDANEMASFEDMKVILRKIAKFSPSGSDTAANFAADKAALNRATSIWAKATKLLQVWKIPEMLSEASGEANLRQQAQQMLKVVTSGDPDVIQGLKELRKLSPEQWRALAVSGQVGAQGVRAGVDFMTGAQ